MEDLAMLGTNLEHSLRYCSKVVQRCDLMGAATRGARRDPCSPTRFHLVILSEHERLWVGSPRPGLVLTDPRDVW